MNTTYVTKQPLRAYPKSVNSGETLTNVQRANLKNSQYEAPDAEAGTFVFFDCQGERYRAFHHDFLVSTQEA